MCLSNKFQDRKFRSAHSSQWTPLRRKNERKFDYLPKHFSSFLSWLLQQNETIFPPSQHTKRERIEKMIFNHHENCSVIASHLSLSCVWNVWKELFRVEEKWNHISAHSRYIAREETEQKKKVKAKNILFLNYKTRHLQMSDIISLSTRHMLGGSRVDHSAEHHRHPFSLKHSPEGGSAGLSLSLWTFFHRFYVTHDIWWWKKVHFLSFASYPHTAHPHVVVSQLT